MKQSYIDRIIAGEVLSIEEEMDMLEIEGKEEREAFKKRQLKPSKAAIARVEEMRRNGEIK